MSALLSSVSLPYLRAHVGRIFLTLLGVIIGVQGMVAMGALNHSIIKSFEAGLEAIAGTARLQIAGPETGIPDTLAEDALRVSGVQSAVAIVDGSLTAADDPSLRIRTFGIDLLSMVGTRSPQFPREHVHIADELGFVNALDSIALGQPLLDRLRAKIGDTVRLATPSGVRSYVIRGMLDDVGPTKLFGGLVALLDLPVAEQVFLSPGLAQIVYIHGDPATDVDVLAARLREAMGDRARVERTEVRGQQMDALLGSVRVALSLASLVTMIAAFFIIYETIAISVEQRRRDIAIARSLGFTRGSIAGVFVLESLALGIVGAAGGTLGGYLLARLSLGTAVAGVSGMYFNVAMGSVALPVADTVAAGASACLVCMLAAVVPAFEAATDPPAQVLRGALGVRPDQPSLRSLSLSFLVLVAAVAILTLDPGAHSTFAKTAWILLGHGLLIAGAGLISSHYIEGISRLFMQLREPKDVSIGLARDFFSRRPKRIATVASAIMVGYALVVVLGSVVYSIESTLGQWIDVTFGADIKIGTGAGLSSGAFDSHLAEPVAALENVSAVERFQKALLIYRNKPVVIVAIDPKRRPDHNPLLIVTSSGDTYDALASGTAVAVSESFARKFDVALGESVRLPTARGQRNFYVTAIVRDYTMDLGTIVVDIEAYQHLWDDTRLTYAHVWPKAGANIDSLRAQINALMSSLPSIEVVTNSEFRRDVQSRVSNLLGVLGSLQVFACAIAILGVVNFLLAAILDRHRELATLRSVGISRHQIHRAIVLEGSLIGFFGSLLGLLTGFPAAYFMVRFSMPVALGWTLDFRFPTLLAASTLVAITAAAALAAYFPARQITRGTILAGLKME